MRKVARVMTMTTAKKVMMIFFFCLKSIVSMSRALPGFSFMVSSLSGSGIQGPAEPHPCADGQVSPDVQIDELVDFPYRGAGHVDDVEGGEKHGRGVLVHDLFHVHLHRHVPAFPTPDDDHVRPFCRGEEPPCRRDRLVDRYRSR